MSTRTFIAMKIENGYKGIYCHWGGHPDRNGRILQEYYSNQDKLNKLIALGNLSSLEKNIGTKHDFNAIPEGESTFYGRDRGDKGEGPVFKETLEDLIKHAIINDCEYLYVFNIDVWDCIELEPYGEYDLTTFH